VSPPVKAITGQEQLPSRSTAAVNVLRRVDDPDASVADLATAIGTDPVFAARVIRVANSTYYGLSGRVSTLPFAVSIIGFQSIRGLAVAAAAGLDGPNAVPEGFWLAAATAAAAADLVAPLMDADPGDAFCLGLLHTLGTALLHQRQATAQLCLPAPAEDVDLLQSEIDEFGIDHARAGAEVLIAWKFPLHLSDVIARHHNPTLADAPPLERVLSAARTLTNLALPNDQTPDRQCSEYDLARLTNGRLATHDLDSLITRLRERAETLLSAFA
jgi:HD-like signal output (HDOD) protein